MFSRLGFPIERRDVWQSLKLAEASLLACVLPVDYLSIAAPRIRRVRDRWTNHPNQIELIVSRTLSDLISKERAYEIDFEWRASVLESRMQIIALHRPYGVWKPTIKIAGVEHIQRAIQHGSGALLWVSDFVYSSLITKMAFCDAGYEVSHLSRPEHGFSGTPYGIHVLNPLWTSIEDRYIAERIMIQEGNATAALEIIRNRLAANRVVSITVAGWGRRRVDVPFFNGAVCLATGPAHLSKTSGAPLLPVFTYRTASGEYSVSIDPPLDTQVCAESYAPAIRSYVKSLEKHVLAYPGQWNGWMRCVKRERLL
jgi:lauroyl/myristoyl acyltransferase